MLSSGVAKLLRFVIVIIKDVNFTKALLPVVDLVKSVVEKVTSGGSRLVRSSGNESPAGSQLFVINGTTITQRIEGSRTHIVKNFAREQQVGAQALLVQQQLHLLRFIACRPLVDFEIIV